jgi:hypothetical protein
MRIRSQEQENIPKLTDKPEFRHFKMTGGLNGGTVRYVLRPITYENRFFI